MRTRIDPSCKALGLETHPLTFLFEPKTVAVIGASNRPGSVGRTLMWNLISSPFGGTVFPVNPNSSNVLGIQTYENLKAIPEQVDLAIIAIPAANVPQVIAECLEIGVKGAIIISAGFREIGEQGIELEEKIKSLAYGKMRVIGPNCLGIMNPKTGLNATFAGTMANLGNVGFISQSGALCTAILDWSFSQNVGFSAFISIGSMLDVDWGDLIYYLGDDPETKSIVIYMESIGNAQSFLSAAREVALSKPIILIKAGQTEAAAKASASHTGALAGSQKVFDAACRRCGVIQVTRIGELFDLAEILSKEPILPKGRHLSIITNAGGPGVLATDALISTGGKLAELAPETVEKLNVFLPTHWSKSNPIDILGDADPKRYAETLKVVLNDPNSDAMLVILTPQAMTDPTETAKALILEAENSSKPLLASWMGGENTSEGKSLLNQEGIPTYRYPDGAARVFNLLWRYTYNLQGIYETPSLASEGEFSPERPKVRSILDTVTRSGRLLLTESESKGILAAYGIPVVPTAVAETVEEAITLAESFGYPVVLKLFSETITHKTDVGGVQLNLLDAEAVGKAWLKIRSSVREKAGLEHFQGVTVQPMLNLNDGYELILGSSIDPQFGPVLLFGSGGQLVEVYQDSAIGLPPLNTTLARRLMQQTKVYTALKGVRGRTAVDLAQLEQILVKFSQLVVENPRIQEIDINPLFVSSKGLTALDARFVLHPLETPDEKLPSPVIRPYPRQYISSYTTKTGKLVTLRPIRPEDEPLMVEFHQQLSLESVYLRYFHLMALKYRIAHERLVRMCFIDYNQEMALVADYRDEETGTHRVLGIGRLTKSHGVNESEFGLLVADPYQRQGIGTAILKRLVEIAQDEGIELISAEVLPENHSMQQVCRKLGFSLVHQNGLVKAELRVNVNCRLGKYS